ALAAFAQAEFLPRGEALDRTFDRFEFALERVFGYLTSLTRDLRQGAELDLGPLLPLDERLAAWNVGAHVSDDLYANKLAFVALLNFPLTTLDERMRDGLGWSRRQWAETRLAGRFQTRVPAEVAASLTAAYSSAEAYVAGYNVFMHHVLSEDGRRLFPAGMRLLSHWNLRDELKARYADPDGLPRQRLIQLVMERIVRQEIPAAVVDNPLLDWTPATGRVAPSPVKDVEAPAGRSAEPRSEREPDERYRRWLAVFAAERRVDPYTKDNPSFVLRRFNVDREIPEAQVKPLLEAILDSPLSARVAKLVQQRLGRPLEPFDIWYGGFRPRGRYSEAELDAITRKRYPTPQAYAADMPRLFREMGFSEERARFLAEHIVVDPSRGSGHAFAAARRDDQAHLRTRVGRDGMDYKGYNIAVHEMGHNVEQVFSVSTIDHPLLQSVPNNAFTEALAFVFQKRDLQLLGLLGDDAQSQALQRLDEFWQTREIAGVALVDMAAWHWLYAHPQATPAELREAVVAVARETWQRHYAPLFGGRDVSLLAVYSHLVDNGLYLPDYAVGHLISLQVEEHFRTLQGPMGPEFERICQLGSITPDAWMRLAVGAPLSAEPLLQASARALDELTPR
ncbi:MAG TPA: hypothetical protein VEQ10_21940, partial [Vicinamibacteria bacterium]|nr:hypothetical protein [Vicinamibacteria bacterium]